MRALALPSPSPFSGQVAAKTQRLGGRCQGQTAGYRLPLTEGARLAAILSPRLAGLGCAASWAPLGAAGALAPPAAHGSRGGFAAEGEDGDGAGWVGAGTP